MAENFPEKKKGDLLGAGHVNALSRIANQFASMGAGSSVHSAGGQVFGAVSTVPRRLQISGVLPVPANPTWPCDVAQYQVTPQYWNIDTKVWTNNPNEGPYCMDGANIAVGLAIADIVIGYWDNTRQTYVAITGKIASDNGGGGGSGDTSGSCCCDELNCLSVSTIPLLGSLKPTYYEFTQGSLVCGCTPPGRAIGSVQLYDVDPVNHLVWEQKHTPADNPPMCLAPAGSQIPCTLTASWVWSPGNSDQGTCSGTWNVTANGVNPSTGGANGFTVTSDNSVCSATGQTGINSGCGTVADSAWPTGSLQGWLNSVSAGATTTVSLSPIPCGGNAGWVLQGVDDPSCVCTPTAPDFAGTVAGQTAMTTCAGSKTVKGNTTLQVAFWRLTIVPALNYFGCDATRLEFIIGS